MLVKKIGKGFKCAKGVVSKGLPILTKVAKMGTLLGKIGLVGGGPLFHIHELATVSYTHLTLPTTPYV